MADLIVKVGDERLVPGRGWQDGDIISAISDRRRLARLARVAWRRDSLTGPPVFERHSEGEYKGGGLHEEIHKVYRRTYVRVVSATEVEITLPGYAPYIVGPPTLIGVNPDTGKKIYEHSATNPKTGKGESIHLDQFLANRRRSGKLLFRDPVTHQVYWYTDEQALPERSALDSLWRKLNRGHGWQSGGHICPELWPMGDGDCRSHLPLFIDDFEEVFEQEWIDTPTARTEIVGDSEQRANRREYRVQWRNLPGMAAKHRRRVLDPMTRFDRRWDHNPLSLSVLKVKA